MADNSLLPQSLGILKPALAKDSLVPQMPTLDSYRARKRDKRGLPITPLQQRTPLKEESISWETEGPSKRDALIA